MLATWSPYFDLDKRILVEKSPPNLLRFRFLQAAFPDAATVYERNIETLRRLGHDGWRKLLTPDSG